MTDVAASARLLQQFAWGSVAAIGLIALIEGARGFAPELPAELSRSRLRELLPMPGSLIATIASLMVGLAGIKLLLSYSGRPWWYRAERSRCSALPSLAAEDLVDRSLAQLVWIGFSTDDKRVEPDGNWMLTCRKKGSSLPRDNRQRAQEVTFHFRDGTLTVVHRLQHTGGPYELGERDYQDWFLDSLLSGVPLDLPPKLLSLGALLFLGPGLTLALVGAGIHFVPEWIAQGWADSTIAGYFVVFLVGAVFGLPVLLFERRPTVGATLSIPGILLAALGCELHLARPYDWERAGWKTSDDPRVVVAAGASAYRTSSPGEWSSCWMTDRELRAWDACAVIEARVLTMGARAAPHLVDLSMGPGAEADWARRMIAKVGEPAIPAIASVFQDPDPDRRQSAIRIAQSVGPYPEIVAPVLGLLRDPDASVRAWAVDYFSIRHDLSNLFSPPPGGPASETIARSLLDLLQDSHKDVREAAVRALGHQRAVEAVPQLIAMLARGDNHAEYALMQIGDPRAIPALVQRLAGGSSGSCEYALASFGAPAIDPLLDHLDTTLAPVAHRILRGLHGDLDHGPPTCARLIGLSHDADPERRITALTLLARSSCPEASGVAVAALTDRDAPIRAAVAWPLFRRGLAATEDLAQLLEQDEAIIEPLLRMLNEPEDMLAAGIVAITGDRLRPTSLRMAALRTLCRVGPDRAGAAAEAMLDTSSPEQRREIIHPVSRAPSPLSTRTLLLLLVDPSEEVRQEAASALGDRNDPVVTDALLRAFLHDSSPIARSSAARALGKLKSTEAVPALCDAVAREGYRVKSSFWSNDDIGRSAIETLGQIGDARARERLSEAFRRAREADDLPTAYTAATALAMTGDAQAIPHLRKIMIRPIGVACGKRGCISLEAIYATLALGRLGEPGADELLSMIASRDHTYPEAAESLGMTRSPRAYQLLVSLLKDPAPLWRAMAAQGLGWLGEPRAIEPLLPVIDDPSYEVTLAAAWALQKLTREEFGVREHEIFPWWPDLQIQGRVRSVVRSWALARDLRPLQQ